MLSKDSILRLVREKGPIIPNQIKKELGSDTIIISALLSELKAAGLVNISHTKIGASPTYYAPENSSKLQDLKKYLNEKDQRTVDLLKRERVLRDNTQEMLIRVSLRNIKDFAKSFEVNVRGEKEVFWRWFLASKEEVEMLVRKQFSKQMPEKKVETSSSKATSVTESKDSGTQKPKVSVAPEDKPLSEPTVVERKEEVLDKPERQAQQTLAKEKVAKDYSDDDLMKQLQNYFGEKNIKVQEEVVIRKNSDIEFQILIPSSIGEVKYFCKAKKKKKCNDGDLSSAYLKGHVLKLPVLFITTGEITKKAMKMLENEFKGMTIKQI